jgi:hypothetical protein
MPVRIILYVLSPCSQLKDRFTIIDILIITYKAV